MEILNLVLRGTRPLLVHNDQLSDPSNKYSKRLSELTSLSAKAKKNDEIQEQTARVEWEGGLYHEDDVGPYIPGFNLIACIREAARMGRDGKKIERGVVCMDDRIPLEYAGPRDIDSMWSAGMSDRRAVGIGNGSSKKRVQRCRPKFDPWSISVRLAYMPDVIDRAALLRIVEQAGAMVGIGDFRARFGRFEVAA